MICGVRKLKITYKREAKKVRTKYARLPFEKRERKIRMGSVFPDSSDFDFSSRGLKKSALL